MNFAKYIFVYSPRVETKKTPKHSTHYVARQKMKMWKMLELDAPLFSQTAISRSKDKEPFFSLLFLAAFLFSSPPSRENIDEKRRKYHDENIFSIMKVHNDEGQWMGVGCRGRREVVSMNRKGSVAVKVCCCGNERRVKSTKIVSLHPTQLSSLFFALFLITEYLRVSRDFRRFFALVSLCSSTQILIARFFFTSRRWWWWWWWWNSHSFEYFPLKLGSRRRFCSRSTHRTSRVPHWHCFPFFLHFLHDC